MIYAYFPFPGITWEDISAADSKASGLRSLLNSIYIEKIANENFYSKETNSKQLKGFF
jgi:hypothetical protein